MLKERYKKHRGILGILTLLVLLFWNPFTRQIILFLLPLGSGVDDLVFYILVVLTIVFGVFNYFQKEKDA